jgi:hypothetical protein
MGEGAYSRSAENAGRGAIETVERSHAPPRTLEAMS